MTDNNTKLAIIKCLIDERNPLILNQIAKKIGQSAQLTEYHVKQLRECGILKCEVMEDRKCYILSSPFYDEGWIAELYQCLTPYAESIATEIKEDVINVNYEKVVNTMAYLLELFIDDLNERKKDEIL